MPKVDRRILQAVKDYLKTSGDPVRRSKIAHEIDQPRKTVGSALYHLLRLGKVHKTSDSSWTTKGSTHKPTTKTVLIADLPAYFVSPWGLPPKEQKNLLKNRKEILIRHVDAWASNQPNQRRLLRQSYPRAHKNFRENFGTKIRVNRLKSALRGFRDAYNAPEHPEKFVSGASWIISDPKHLENAEFTLNGMETIGTFHALPDNTALGSEKQLTFGEDSIWMINSQPELWFGKNSQEGLRTLANLNPSLRRSIKLSLVKIIRDIHPDKTYDANADVVDRIDQVTSKIPIRVLHAHTSSQSVTSAISRIERAGILSLGALCLLSDSCFESFRSLQQDYWDRISGLLKIQD